MATLNRGGLERFRQSLSPLALRGAEAAADVLREKLSGPGTGVHYPGQPNPSSREGEYPAEQTSRLVGTIAARPAGPGQAQFGAIDDPPDCLGDFHFKPPGEGGRPFMDHALADADIHQAVSTALGLK